MQLVDEFDIIYDLILPFLGLKPETIRARAKEALSYNNNLLEVTIRNHTVLYIEGQQQYWFRDATRDILAKFMQHLPDMDLAINALDEPRVVVPSDDLSRLMHTGRVNMHTSSTNTKPRNGFTPLPDLVDVQSFQGTNLTRFNSFHKQ